MPVRPFFTLLCISLSAGAAETLPVVALSDLQIERAGIETATVISHAAEHGAELRLNGSARASNSSQQVVAATMPGTVFRVLADALTPVAAGHPLAEIASPEFITLQQEYLQAQAEAGIATGRAARDEQLLADGLIATGRFEESRARSAQAASLVEEHRQSLLLAGVAANELASLRQAGDLRSRLTIRAPQSGTLLEQLASPGQRVEAGTPLFRIADASRLWIELRATAAESSLIRPGDAVRLIGCETSARIVSVSPEFDAANQSTLLRAEFPEAQDCVRVNQYVTAAVTAGAGIDAAAGIPLSAIVRSEGRDYVFVRESGGFRPMQLDVVARGGGFAWTSTALPADAAVAVRGVTTLRGAWIGLGPEAP